MFIVIQFPISDSRSFINCETHKLIKPAWPLARPDKEFVRFYGPVRTRKKGGIKDWSGEDLYSCANRALRLPELEKERLGNANSKLAPDCAFRRFFSNGEAVTRLEVAFRTKRIQQYSDETSMLSVIENCLSLPSVVPLNGSDDESCDLQMAGQRLAKLYLNASTRSSVLKNRFVQDWWVTEGRPLVLVESKEHDKKAIPKIAKSVKKLEEFDIDLSHFWINRKGEMIRVWLFGYSKYSDFDVVRRLRLNLLRLHAEQECLREILRHISLREIIVEAGSDATERLQQYLNDATKMILKNKRFGLSQTDLLDAALDYEDIVSEGQRATLFCQLEKIRRNILKKIEKYTAPIPKDQFNRNAVIVYKPSAGVNVIDGDVKQIGDRTMNRISVTLGNGNVFKGDVVVAENIRDSFNRAKESEVNETLKEKLKELSSLIAELCEKLPEEKAEEVSRDLHSFVSEATSRNPRKKWYKNIAGSLIKAANTVDKLAGPIISTVKAVTGLL